MKKTINAIAVMLLLLPIIPIAIALSGCTNSYIVTYDYGYDGITETESIKSGHYLPEKIPTREGYVFDEWLLDGKPFDYDSYTVSQNITLVATWATQYSLTYTIAGETKIMPFELADIPLLVQMSQGDLNALGYDKDAYDWIGWYTEKDGAYIPYTGNIVNDVRAGHLTLYGDIMSKGLAIENGIVTGYSDDVYDKYNKVQHVVIPTYYQGVAVTAIADKAFYRDNSSITVRGVTFPRRLETIGEDAFANVKGLGDIQLPATLTTIGDGAFAMHDDTQSLLSIEFAPNTRLTHLPRAIFRHQAGLQTVTLHEGLTHIGERAFENCRSLRAITLPQRLQYISRYAFAVSGINHISIPASIQKVDSYAFMGADKLIDILVSTDYDQDIFATEWNRIEHFKDENGEYTEREEDDAVKYPELAPTYYNPRRINIDYNGGSSTTSTGRNVYIGTYTEGVVKSVLPDKLPTGATKFLGFAYPKETDGETDEYTIITDEKGLILPEYLHILPASGIINLIAIYEYPSP